MKLSKMGYKMAANIKCLALGEQYGYVKLTGPLLIMQFWYSFPQPVEIKLQNR